jgi:hypothetical protein
MDNHIVDVRSVGHESFEHSLALFLGEHMGAHRKVSHTCIIDPDEPSTDEFRKTDIVHPRAPTFVLFWAEPKNWKFGEVNKLPYPMGRRRVGDLVWDWLQERPDAEYAEGIDMDGSLGKGAFRMWNEQWTHVGNSPYGICAIRPIFAWYGK